MVLRNLGWLFVSLCLVPVRGFSDTTGQELSSADVEIAKSIEYISRLRHNSDRALRSLVRKHQAESNRLCRVAQAVYRMKDDYPSRLAALEILGQCGDTNQVTFLDSCVTDLRMGPTAIQVLDEIEGFTSNSVLRTARYHAITNQEVYSTDMRAYSDRTFILGRLVFAATRPNVPAHLKDFTRDYVYSFASNNCSSVNAADRELMNLDPTFKNSKRRLALLRYAQPRTHEPYVPQYLATEIQKLEEYPEENLPE